MTTIPPLTGLSAMARRAQDTELSDQTWKWRGHEGTLVVAAGLGLLLLGKAAALVAVTAFLVNKLVANLLIEYDHWKLPLPFRLAERAPWRLILIGGLLLSSVQPMIGMVVAAVCASMEALRSSLHPSQIESS